MLCDYFFKTIFDLFECLSLIIILLAILTLNIYRVHIQELAGLNEFDYLGLYREHFRHKMDISIFDSPPPSKLPPAPRRLRYISSYRRSLGSLKSVGYVVPRVGQGSISRRHRPKRQIRTRGVPETEPASPSLLGDQSPEI